MSSSKVYSIQNAFPNHKVATDRLTQEIGRSSIVIALDYIKTYLDNCTINFKYDLEPSEWSILDGVVAGHSGEALVQPPQLVDIGGVKTSDGTPIISPCIFPAGVYLFVCGASDSDTVRGEGGLFTVSSGVAGDTIKDLDHFLDFVYVAGGSLVFSGAQLGDWVSARMVCPATTFVPSSNNTGNCNLMTCPPCPGVPVGSKIAIPANGNGAYNVNLATATPVPSHDTDMPGVGSGFYAWNEPSNGIGRGTITPVPEMTGDYHFLDHEVQLVNFVNRVLILGAGTLNVSTSNVKPKKMLPHWHGRLMLHNIGHAGLQVALMIVTARKVTV